MPNPDLQTTEFMRQTQFYTRCSYVVMVIAILVTGINLWLKFK